jgi:hypothetical protein
MEYKLNLTIDEIKLLVIMLRGIRDKGLSVDMSVAPEEGLEKVANMILTNKILDQLEEQDIGRVYEFEIEKQ